MKTECPFCGAHLEDGGRVGGLMFHPSTRCPMSGEANKREGWKMLADALSFANDRNEGKDAP